VAAAGRGSEQEGAWVAEDRAPTPLAHNEAVFHHDDPGDSLPLIQNGRFSIQEMTSLGDVATVAVRGLAGSRRASPRWR
jgi:hypothetical protein